MWQTHYYTSLSKADLPTSLSIFIFMRVFMCSVTFEMLCLCLLIFVFSGYTMFTTIQRSHICDEWMMLTADCISQSCHLLSERPVYTQWRSKGVVPLESDDTIPLSEIWLYAFYMPCTPCQHPIISAFTLVGIWPILQTACAEVPLTLPPFLKWKIIAFEKKIQE